MNILIAGASGFIGRNLLLKTPPSWTITGLYNTNQSFPNFLTQNKLNHVAALQCDLRDTSQVKSAFSINNQFDVCLFVLGNSDIGLSIREPQTDFHSNITTLLNLITHIKVRRFIFMSSGTVYLGRSGLVGAESKTEPLVPYGIHKLASEEYIKFFQSKTDRIKEYVILRFFGAYGPMELPRKIYTNLIKNFYLNGENEYTLLGGGENLIDAMYIDDTVEGLLKVITSYNADCTVDFCKGAPCSINELVKSVGGILSNKPITIKHSGTSSEPIMFWASPFLMKRIYGFEPKITLKDGMLKFAEYLKNHHG